MNSRIGKVTIPLKYREYWNSRVDKWFILRIIIKQNRIRPSQWSISI